MGTLIDALTTPFAKRVTVALLERALLLAVGAALTWLKVDQTPELHTDVVKFVADVAAATSALFFTWLVWRKAHLTELTIEAARTLPEHTPRPVVDATARSLYHWPPLPSDPKPPRGPDDFDY